MFNKLKQIKDLRTKAKKIQATLGEEMVETTSKGIHLKMDGNQKVHSISIPSDLMQDKARLEAALVDSLNDSIKQVQKVMAKKLQKMGDLDLPGLGL